MNSKTALITPINRQCDSRSVASQISATGFNGIMISLQLTDNTAYAGLYLPKGCEAKRHQLCDSCAPHCWPDVLAQHWQNEMVM